MSESLSFTAASPEAALVSGPGSGSDSGSVSRAPADSAPSAPSPPFGHDAEKTANPCPVPPPLQVAAGIIWRQGRFLAALRPAGKPRSGFWEFPGGKREPGESLEETLRRELEEELGITCLRVTPWQTVVHDYPDQRVALHFMQVTAFTGLPVARDGQELRWVTPEEARALPFLPADTALVAALTPPEEERPRPARP